MKNFDISIYENSNSKSQSTHNLSNPTNMYKISVSGAQPPNHGIEICETQKDLEIVNE